MRAATSPAAALPALVVAAAAYLVGGLGNVAFSAHRGSVAGLLLLRFLFGAIGSKVFLVKFPAPRPESTLVRRARLWGSLAAFSEAGAVVLLVAASQYVSTLAFTLIGLVGTAALAPIGRRLSLGSGTRAQASAAALAVLVTATAVLLDDDLSEGVGLLGLVLACASTVLGLVSSVSGALAARARHPAEMVFSMTCWGFVLVLGLLFAGAELSISASTVVAAGFIALLPGGLAKAGIYWSFRHAPPYLVSACSSVALLTAALGGWVVLGERPAPSTLALSAVAAGFVAFAALKAPAPAARS